MQSIRYVLENKIEGYFCERVKLVLSGKAIKNDPRIKKGMPDRSVYIPYTVFSMAELKRPVGGILSETQIAVQDWLSVCGIKTYNIHTVELIEKFIEEKLQEQIRNKFLYKIRNVKRV